MPRTLLLIDLPDFVFRAALALPVQRDGDGAPVAAIHAMGELLQVLQRDFPCDGAACVLDGGADSYRQALYPAYRQGRGAVPPSLQRQQAALLELVDAMGWQTVSVAGVGVRDVVATLAQHASDRGWHTVIASADQDLAQIVDAQVSLIHPIEHTRVGHQDVPGRYGVAPALLPDLFALAGDPLDGIAGVPGGGMKMARLWLSQYGTLDALLANAEEVQGRLGDKLRAARDWLPLARQLKTVRRDCALGPWAERFDSALQAWDCNQEAFHALLRRHAVAQQTEVIPPGQVLVSVPPLFARLEEANALGAWMGRAAGAPLAGLYLVGEGSGALACRLQGIGLAIAPGECAYLAWPDDLSQARQSAPYQRLLDWLSDASQAKVVHGVKRCSHLLANQGVTLRGVVDDVELASYVLDPSATHSLTGIARRYLNHSAMALPAEQADGPRGSAAQAERAALSADLLLRLQTALAGRLAALPALAELYRDLELPLAAVLTAMERSGVLLDAALLQRQSAALAARLQALQQQAWDLCGAEWPVESASAQASLLFDRLQLPLADRTRRGAPSLSDAVLARLAPLHPVAGVIRTFRQLSTLKNSYTDKLPRWIDRRSGRVHTDYGQTTAATGRLASREPPLQSIPVRSETGREIRQAFVAGPGRCIVAADYSQIELRVLAHLSADPVLCQAFVDGVDVHAVTAAEVLGLDPAASLSAEQRRYGKEINFGLINGMGAPRLAERLGVSKDEAKAYLARYFARFAGVAAYLEQSGSAAREQGYALTLLGRRISVPGLHSSQYARRASAERAAINAPMQGSAADLIKLAMLAIQRWLLEQRLGARLLMQVHDEVVLEVPLEELVAVQAALPALMTGVAQLAVPLVVDIGYGPSWADAH